MQQATIMIKGKTAIKIFLRCYKDILCYVWLAKCYQNIFGGLPFWLAS